MLPALPESLERATLKFHGEAATPFRILDSILTPALLRERYAAIPSITWQYPWEKFYKVSLRCIYMSFAIYCKIQGEYNKPVKARRCPRPLKTAVHKARKYFKSTLKVYPTPHIQTPRSY